MHAQMHLLDKDIRPRYFSRTSYAPPEQGSAEKVPRSYLPNCPPRSAAVTRGKYEMVYPGNVWEQAKESGALFDLAART